MRVTPLGGALFVAGVLCGAGLTRLEPQLAGLAAAAPPGVAQPPGAKSASGGGGGGQPRAKPAAAADMRTLVFGAHGAKGAEGTVLVVSPMRDRKHALERYFRLLDGLSYPRHLISLAIIEGDSKDGTFAALQERFRHSTLGLRRVTLIKQDTAYQIDRFQRHKHNVQGPRRSHLGKVRNWLTQSSLIDEEWVMWMDADLWSYPQNLVQSLLASKKRLVVPHVVGECKNKGSCNTFDLNSWQETAKSRAMQKKIPRDQLLFEGYHSPTHRKHMSHLRRECDPKLGETCLAKLDGVGGGIILVKADLHRDGLVFPTFAFQHAIETEGYAKFALAMGVQPWGMPKLEVIHK